METYTPYDFTSSRPRKTTIAFFGNFGGIELKFENYESMEHRLQFSGIKRGAEISFHRHFKDHFSQQMTIATEENNVVELGEF